MNLRTHLVDRPEVLDIQYDYEGPCGCQRKLVRTASLLYVYHQIGNAWVIRENVPL